MIDGDRTQTSGEAAPTAAPRRGIVAWCLFDWANSAFPTIIVTFVFDAYFTGAIAESPERGTAQWGWALSASALFVALAGPLLGAVADQGGRRKPWLGATTAICILASAALWVVAPGPLFLLPALVLVAIANAAFELGQVFYNAMLPELAPPTHLGRVSGWAWGLGYAGGLVSLGLVLILFVQPETPLFGLDRAAAEPVRIVGPMVALWFLVFAVPLFVWTPDRPASGLPFGAALGQGLRKLRGTLSNLGPHGNVVLFLVARMAYTDGLNTLFAFGGIYAAGTFGMDIAHVIAFGIALNVTAGLGALAFAWVDDLIGAKRTLVISIVGLIVFAAAALLAPSEAWFWAAALGLGVFIGPTQSASRSMMARLAPPERRTEMFGLFALSGRVTAFAGPALVAWATVALDSQRAGMATILAFLAVGLALLLPLPDPDRGRGGVHTAAP